MPFTMYSASAPVFVRMLSNAQVWLDKAQVHAEAKKFDPKVFLEARLAPDMLAFAKQIQIACDTAKFCVARLAGVESPKFSDDEANLDQLRERLRNTVEFVRSITPEQLIGSETREVSMPRRDGAIQMSGEAYLQEFVLPNFYFHLTTTYALLRHWGVDLGKMDFLGAKKG